MILPDAPFRRRAGLDRLTVALEAEHGQLRFVGGAVRDALLGLDVTDVDLATRYRPDEVVRRLRDADIRTVPTGIAHGTVTALLPSGPVEVTTLRRDLATDGRRATIAFSDDWREDAARRDFTINALYADPLAGTILDYFGGLDDLANRRLRFIGEPLERIAEDHLRILRFFRFHARFGRGAPDAAALAACAARANDLMALSRERIADELLKLLAVADPAPTVALMLDHAILRPVLPEIDAAGLARLCALIACEARAAITPAGLRRLAALLPPDSTTAAAVAIRLKLSKAARARLVAAADRGLPCPAPALLAYRIGAEAAVDRLLIDGDAQGARTLDGWERPRLPISGGDLIALGLAPGPVVAATLQAIERRWSEEGFPDAARVDAIACDAVAQALRARQ